MTPLRRLSLAAVPPASPDGPPCPPQAGGRAPSAARPPVPGGRHRSRTSRGDAAAQRPGAGVTMSPAAPAWDADQAVAELYHAYYCPLTRLAALLVIGVAAAEEAIQVAFAALHGGWRHLPDVDKALAYLLRAVVVRTRSNRAACPALPRREPSLPRAGRPAITVSDAPLLAALHTLPARQREALVLRYYAGLPDTEIAAAMGIRASAVTRHVRRGMTTLPGCPPGSSLFQPGHGECRSRANTQVCPAGRSLRCCGSAPARGSSHIGSGAPLHHPAPRPHDRSGAESGRGLRRRVVPAASLIDGAPGSLVGSSNRTRPGGNTCDRC